MAVEDVDHRARDELLDHAVFARLVAEGLELDLAGGRGNHGGESLMRGAASRSERLLEEYVLAAPA